MMYSKRGLTGCLRVVMNTLQGLQTTPVNELCPRHALFEVTASRFLRVVGFAVSSCEAAAGGGCNGGWGLRLRLLWTIAAWTSSRGRHDCAHQHCQYSERPHGCLRFLDYLYTCASEHLTSSTSFATKSALATKKVTDRMHRIRDNGIYLCNAHKGRVDNTALEALDEKVLQSISAGQTAISSFRMPAICPIIMLLQIAGS